MSDPPKIKITYIPTQGLFQEAGDQGVFIKSDTIVSDIPGLDVTRNVTLRTSPTAGVSEISGSLLQLKGRQEGIHFHMGGNQYISNNCWFDRNTGDFGSWIYESDSSAFRWGFVGSSGRFDLDYGGAGSTGDVVTFGTGLSMTSSNGAIGLGKKASNGLSATFDVTGSNPIALAVTGSVDIGGGAPDSYFILPRLTTDQRDALNAVNGMMIYNTTLNKFQGFQAGSWQNLIA